MTAARKTLLRPPALGAGDTIGIVAPAGAVDRAEFVAGEARLRTLGFNVVYSEGIFERDIYFAGSVQRRVDELHEMFCAREVKAVICARGGYGTNHLLPHLDLDLIAGYPKVFCGYSDVTTLTTVLLQRTGLVGFHGPMLAKDFCKPDGVHVESFLSAVSGTQPWSLDTADSPALQPLRSGSAEGRLYGGCLSLLVASLATPYEIETEDAILFIEDLVPSKPDRPSNFRFVQGNVLEGLPFLEGCFDLVHQRLLVSGVPTERWPAVVADLVRMTRPGGWVQLVEAMPRLEPEGPATQRLYELLRELGATAGLDVRGDVPPSLGHYLQGAGAMAVQLRNLTLPVGAWGGHVGYWLACGYRVLFMGLTSIFERRYGLAADECRQLIGVMLEEYEQLRPTIGVKIALGRRPA